MPIVVETGVIVDGANSYASVQDLQDYACARNIELAATTPVLESLLIKAMDYISAEFGSRWQGERVSSDQPLDWPRAHVWLDGARLPSDEIPRKLFYGQLAAAIEAKTQDLQPNATPGVTKEKVGDIERVYANSGKRMPVSAFSKPAALLLPLCRNGGLALATRA